ncbi:hypothetical protein Mgra_00002467 [Meloidogyne graminicola]|uniref:RRM domain-containing protein n=1 Tax=Meloidogyne graminicola TaxID=189291 RepID=A0A8S9ZWA9_9BILA|nr:hypothetical protein Mgra_00002467 [Meloidogyne graminicola]
MGDNQRLVGFSIAEANAEFTKAIEKLGNLWDSVHMSTDMRKERLDQVKGFQCNLLKEIVTSEEKLKAINDELDRLTKKREQGFKAQKELYAKYESACHRLGETPDAIHGLNSRFLSSSELDTLRSKFDESRRILNERLDKAFKYQAEAIKIHDIIHHASAPVLTEEDQNYMKINLNNAVVSTTLLDKLEFLCQKLKDQHDAWLEEVAFRYDELLIQFNDVSEKCFMLPPSKLNETELKKLEEQVKARKERYNRAQPVFDMLKEWMDCWKQKLETERRVCRASFYKNRGGNLNQKLKQRKLLDMKVPKLLDDLRALCDKYEEHYGVDDIIVEGVRADQYASKIIEEYEHEKELLRVQKISKMWSNDRLGGTNCERRRGNQNSLVFKSSFQESQGDSIDLNMCSTVIVIGSFANCSDKIPTELLRFLINQHAAKDKAFKSYSESITELYYAPGDAFAFVIVWFYFLKIIMYKQLFYPKTLFSKLDKDNNIVSKQPSQLPTLESNNKTKPVKHASSIETIKPVNGQASAVNDDPWGRAADGSWDAQDNGWDTFKTNDSWGDVKKTTRGGLDGSWDAQDNGWDTFKTNDSWGDVKKTRGGRGNVRGGQGGGRGRNFFPRNDFNIGDRTFPTRSIHNGGNRGFTPKNANEDSIIEKKVAGRNSNNQYYNDRTSFNNTDRFSNNSSDRRFIHPLIKPPSICSNGPIWRGRGRGGVSNGQQRSENIFQDQQVNLSGGGRNENNQRNDETDGSDGHEEEHKQEKNCVDSNYGQQPKGVCLKDDPNEFKDDSNGERFDNPPSKVIYIANLPGDVNKTDVIRMLFEKKLNIVDCFVSRTRCDNDKELAAYAFAELESEEKARQAIEILNDNEFLNRKMRVLFARRQTINLSTSMMKEAKRRRNYGGLGGDTCSVASAPADNNNNNNDAWDFGANSLCGGSADSWANFEDKTDVSPIVSSIKTLENDEIINANGINKDQVVDEVFQDELCLDAIDGDQLKSTDDDFVEISNVVEFLVESIANEFNEDETPFSSTSSLLMKDNEEGETPFASIESLLEVGKE